MMDPPQVGKESTKAIHKFSVPGGKRRIIAVQTTNMAAYCRTLQERWNEGAFCWVHKGRYEQNPYKAYDTAGAQLGQLCVIKKFKTGSVYKEIFLVKIFLLWRKLHTSSISVQRLRKPQEKSDWDGAKTIHLNRPVVWRDVHSDHTGKHTRKMVEPMLEGEFLQLRLHKRCRI